MQGLRKILEPSEDGGVYLWLQERGLKAARKHVPPSPGTFRALTLDEVLKAVEGMEEYMLVHKDDVGKRVDGEREEYDEYLAVVESLELARVMFGPHVHFLTRDMAQQLMGQRFFRLSISARLFDHLYGVRLSPFVLLQKVCEAQLAKQSDPPKHGHTMGGLELWNRFGGELCYQKGQDQARSDDPPTYYKEDRTFLRPDQLGLLLPSNWSDPIMVFAERLGEGQQERPPVKNYYTPGKWTGKAIRPFRPKSSGR